MSTKLENRGFVGGYRQRRTVAGVVAAAALCLVGSATVLAQSPPELQKFAGTWVYDGSRDDGVEIVEKAIDRAMKNSNLIVRSLAKKGAGDRFAMTMTIKVTGGKLAIKVGALPEAAGELNKTQTVKDEEGREGRLTYRFDDGAITATIAGDRGTIRTIYKLGSDGKLTREVKVSGGELSKPLQYKLVYKRK